MTVTPVSATLLPTATLANSNPLLALAANPAGPTGVPLGSAQLGVAALGTERPSFGARIVGAIKAAVGELRGSGGGTNVNLGLQATAAVDPARMAAASVPLSSLVPGNATRLPGGTVYSFDANGNPALAGLSGLPQATQQQLGLTTAAALSNGIDAMTGQVPTSTRTPQINATNQVSIPTGAINGRMPSATPVLGAPIAVAPIVDTPAGSTSPQPPAPGQVGAAVPGSALAAGTNQTVANRNTTENQSQQIASPWGGLGGYGLDQGLGYGASMNGIGNTGGVRGFFSRLLT